MSRAQMLAFAPFAFFAATTMRDTGLLSSLENAGAEGLTRAELARDTGLSEYAVAVLVDFGQDLEILSEQEEACTLAPLGHILLHDPMTRVNMDFTRDFASHGLPALETAIREGRPAGLAALGDWSTLYEGLHELEEPAAGSWFRFDHYYSEHAFRDLVERLARDAPRHVMDVGANTGRLALRYLDRDPEACMTLLDLPGPLQMAREALEAAGQADRAHLHPTDLRDNSRELPGGADAIVMSQLLACFPPEEIVALLRRTARAMDPETRLYIVELCPDRQIHEAARFSLNAVSLYFTCMVNGTSRFYPRDTLGRLIDEAGLMIDHEEEPIGVGHTLLRCRRR